VHIHTKMETVQTHFKRTSQVLETHVGLEDTHVS